jgi:Peptidase family M23
LCAATLGRVFAPPVDAETTGTVQAKRTSRARAEIHFTDKTTQTTAGQVQATPSTENTALLISSTNAPLQVLGSDGMQHLEYDLIVSNVFGAPVTLTAVEVFGDDGTQLFRLTGDDLLANTEPIFYVGQKVTPPSSIPVDGSVAVIMDVVVPIGEVPGRVENRVSYALPSDARALAIIPGRAVYGPDLDVDPRQPIVIAPPLRGSGWYAGSGCCAAYSVHRSPRLVVDGDRYIKPETFAIDWSQLSGARLFASDGSQNQQYFGFGADILSVADGTVVSVRDGMPDQTPNQIPAGVDQPEDFIGNHVIVQIQPDVWAIYAHLELGSVAVHAGDSVAAGQLLGRLGNSGNSFGPHLHFQLSDSPEIFGSTSLPYLFDSYTLAGTVSAAAVEEDAPGDTEGPSEQPQAIISGTPTAQNGTYPLVDTVQDFP